MSSETSSAAQACYCVDTEAETLQGTQRECESPREEDKLVDILQRATLIYCTSKLRISYSFVNEENAYLCQTASSESRGQNNKSPVERGPVSRKHAENLELKKKTIVGFRKKISKQWSRLG